MQAVAMKKGLRSWNRRDFNVAVNGYFTVLKPTGWFSAARLPGTFRYLTGQTRQKKSGPDQKLLPHAYGQQTTMQYAIIDSGNDAPRLGRSAFIVFASAALTSILLWWIMHP
jgi:hypothetical protein